MTDFFVPRTLSFLKDRERASVAAKDALTDARLAGRPLIVLGEAGSGKSELLRNWSHDNVTTARQLVNGWQPRQGRNFVDGLDEAAGLKDGDALDRVLGALGAQRKADFVLACRVADWQSASAKETIKSWTGIDPVELTIEPLQRAEIAAFLGSQAGFDAAAAERFLDHYEQRSLNEWLGNPQTLKMLAEVTCDGSRPETTGALFSLYIDRTWQEHRKQAGQLAHAAQDDVLAALGALFAALIVGGYDALTLAPGADRLASDLPLSECKALPGVTGLSVETLREYLGSRLVVGAGPDRYTYQHRRIGEYLGAQWFAQHATTCELRTRLLGALRHGDIVPSGLRGLWGWLASDERLAGEVIGTDPLAVIDYGNADDLNPSAAKALLQAIEVAEDRSEEFGRREYRAAALVQPDLGDEVERVLAVSGKKRFWTQIILLRQFRNRDTVSRHAATLRAIMLDEARPYATRDAAADALADYDHLPDWPAIIDRLANGASRDSLRLALVMMLNPRVGLTLSDAAFAETVYAYSGLSPRFKEARGVSTVALYHVGKRQAIGDQRLDGMLDALVDCAKRYLDDNYNSNAWDVQRLFYALLERRLTLGGVEAEDVWRWLNHGRYDDYGRTRDARDRIDLWLQANQGIRRALQRKVLDACAETPQKIVSRLREVTPGLWPTAEDVIALLDWLPEADPRWQEVIRLAPRRAEGHGARDAAARHVRTDEDGDILRDHADPPLPSWELEEAKRQKRDAAKRESRREAIRADYLAARERIRRGDYGAVIGPAQVYMGRVYEAKGELPPEERIGTWIGEDLQAEAFLGFEAFLTADPPKPTATQIAESFAKSRSWPAALIVVAALNQRLRGGHGFADLPDERMQAGLIELVGGLFSDDEWKPLHAALSDELVRRGAWETYARLLIEPQFRRRASYPTGLWEVLAAPGGTALAADWLRAFGRMSAEPEQVLVDHLQREGSASSRDVLVEVAKRRRRSSTLDDPRRQNWQAVELILGLASPEDIIPRAAQSRDFLWVLRDRMSRRRRDESKAIAASPSLLAAIIATFMPLWPSAEHPSDGWTGNVNPWDASEFLRRCLASLAADPSPDASAALATLTTLDHGYAWSIGRSITDQRRARANAEWQPLRVGALCKLVTDGLPIDHADLQRVLLAELNIVQAKLRSSDADVWQFFFDNKQPKLEEPCTDALVTLLDHKESPLTFKREPHLGDNREGDIWCESGNLAIAIECKRHWHPDLWTAFDWQLARQQAADWRAGGYGVYVVYWFGTAVRAVTGPPRGSGIARSTTPEALEASLRQRIADAGLPGIVVKVIDVSRPLR
jgi:hypothetical protein